jgi:hypothetical protein
MSWTTSRARSTRLIHSRATGRALLKRADALLFEW